MADEQDHSAWMCDVLRQQIAATRSALTGAERKTNHLTMEIKRMAREVETGRLRVLAAEERAGASLWQRRRHNTKRLMRDRETTARFYIKQKLRDMMQAMTKRQERDRDLHADVGRRCWKRCEPWLVKVLAWFFEGALVLLSIGISVTSAIVFVFRFISYCVRCVLSCSRLRDDPLWRSKSKVGVELYNTQLQKFNEQR